MKILIYPHDLNMGGSQMNAIDLAAAVTALGHECIIFARRGTLCDRIAQLGLEFIESPDPGRRPSPRIAKALRAIALERGIDVIHGYEWPPGLEAAMAAERLPDVAAVCTVMSMAVAPFLPRWMPLVVGTQQISAREQAAGRSTVSLIEPPVDLEHNRDVGADAIEEFTAAWHLDDRPVVVCVSRLVPELKSEGIFTAIEAAAAMADTLPFQLVVVGDGRARAEMERAAARTNGVVGRATVIFTGELADPRPAYAAADVVLGMGGSALRSLAFGRPLIVQGERGFFRTLTPESLEVFRWQGWYGVGEGGTGGLPALTAELSALLVDADRRRALGEFGAAVAQEFSLERAAHRQLAIYRDAWASRAEQKRPGRDAGRARAGRAGYHVGPRGARGRGRQRADDFNAEPIAGQPAPPTATAARPGDGPILYFPGVGWDTLAGTDRQLALALSKDHRVVWVDTPHSPFRRRDRIVPAVTHPAANIVRLRAATLPGVQRPLLRAVANRRRAQVARQYLRTNGWEPTAVIASTTAPMLALTRDLAGAKVYYATDDFVEAAMLWGVSKRYLGASREANLAAADLVAAVTPELARHLQRTSSAPRWLPNGADLDRFRQIEEASVVEVRLDGPIAGVVGQFNSRTDLRFLQAVQRGGISLLLVGPRDFSTPQEQDEFDALTRMPRVHWVDQVAREDLSRYLRLLAVGLTPYRDSMFNRRSYPLKTLEYLAAGVPVVATDVAATDGLDPRFVVAERSPQAFADRVAQVAAAPPCRGEVQQSVHADGWDARATELLGWLGRLRAESTPRRTP